MWQLRWQFNEAEQIPSRAGHDLPSVAFDETQRALKLLLRQPMLCFDSPQQLSMLLSEEGMDGVSHGWGRLNARRTL